MVNLQQITRDILILLAKNEPTITLMELYEQDEDGSQINIEVKIRHLISERG